MIEPFEFYGEFSKKAGTTYLQVVLTPMHARVSTDYGYVIWGQWPDGQSMCNEWGSYTNEFWACMAEQDEPIEMAGTCTGSIAMFNSSTTHRRILWEDRDGWQPHSGRIAHWGKARH